MGNKQQHVKILKKGVKAWNKWREQHPEPGLDLSEINLYKINLSGVNLAYCDLSNGNFTDTNFSGANLAGVSLGFACVAGANFNKANLTGARIDRSAGQYANFSNAILNEASLCLADLSHANFTKAKLAKARFFESDLSHAKLNHADLRGAELVTAFCYQTNLKYANLEGANLQHIVINESNLQGAVLTNCKIYGLAAWGLKGIPKDQRNLIITPNKKDHITVDDLQVGQFIYLLLNNKNVRNVIDTITSKAVLILGRFTAQRKVVLDALHKELRQRNYLPILFDFKGPDNRDVTETVSTLAHLARFVIADITDAKSVLQELRGIVPELPSLPIKPILLSTQQEPGMFGFFQRFPSFLDTFYYNDINEVVGAIDHEIIKPLEDRFLQVKPK